MPSVDQNSIDDLLAQVQSQANAIESAAQAPLPAAAAADAAAAVDGATASAGEIAGDMESPTAPLEAAAGAADLGSFTPPPAAEAAAGNSKDLGRLLAIEVPVIVQLGMRRLTVGEVMRLAVGAIIEFGKSAEEELDLMVNNKAVGKGHAVKVGENFGIKISAINPVKDTIRKLGAA